MGPVSLLLAGADSMQNIFEDILLEDLHDPESTDGIVLNMSDRERYFDGRVTGETRELGSDNVVPRSP